MAAILYVNGADGTFTSIQPDMTGKEEISVEIPDGLPLNFAVNQLSSLLNGILPAGIAPPPDYSGIVFKVTIGTV